MAISTELLDFKIITKIERPDKTIIEGLKGIPSSNVGDVIGRNAAIDPGLIPRNKALLVGPAFTIKSPPRDNLMIHKALDMAEKGDVLVIDVAGSAEGALVGEIIVRYAQYRGIAGIVINGCIRDADELSRMDFPVYSRWLNPNGALTKTGPGEINVPIVINGKVICPGDIIIGDADGLVLLKRQDAQEALVKARELMQMERSLIAGFANGGSILDRSWIEPAISQGCKIL